MDIHVGQNKRASIEGGAGLTGRDSLDHNKEPQHRFYSPPHPKKNIPILNFFFSLLLCRLVPPAAGVKQQLGI